MRTIKFPEDQTTFPPINDRAGAGYIVISDVERLFFLSSYQTYGYYFEFKREIISSLYLVTDRRNNFFKNKFK